MLGWALPSRPGVRPEQSQLAACGTSRLSAVSNSVTSTRWPLPVCWRARERQQDAGEGVVAGDVVDDGDADPRRPRLRRAVDAHHAAHRLQHRVVARQAAQRAVGTEAGDGAIDQARDGGRQHALVAQAPALQGARQEVLDQHVGVLQQRLEDGAVLRAVRQVEGDARACRG